jgi:hypothetical protein
MKTTTRAMLVLATMLIAVATASAAEPAINLKIKIEPVMHIAGVWMQVQNASAPVKDELFAGTEKFSQGASSVTEINLDPTTMGMLGDRHGRDAELARKVNFMVVRSYTYPKPGMYNADDVEAFRKRLEDGSWSCPIRVRNEGGSSEICTRGGADHETNELVILSARPDKLSFIHISGKMSLGELNDMTGRAGGIMPHVVVMPHPIVDTHINVDRHVGPRGPGARHANPDSPQAPQSPESNQPQQSTQAPQPPQ